MISISATLPSSVVRFEPRKPNQSERFVMLRHSLLQSPPWRNAPAVARALYVAMAERHNGKNNGQIPFSSRDVAEAFGVSEATGWRWLTLLEKSVLVRCTSRGSFDVKSKEGQASLWELTEFSGEQRMTACASYLKPSNPCASPVEPNGFIHETALRFTSEALINKKESIDLDKKEDCNFSSRNLPKEDKKEDPSTSPSAVLSSTSSFNGDSRPAAAGGDVPRAARPPREGPPPGMVLVRQGTAQHERLRQSAAAEGKELPEGDFTVPLEQAQTMLWGAGR
jgi:hypothetical protein